MTPAPARLGLDHRTGPVGRCAGPARPLRQRGPWLRPRPTGPPVLGPPQPPRRVSASGSEHRAGGLAQPGDRLQKQLFYQKDGGGLANAAGNHPCTTQRVLVRPHKKADARQRPRDPTLLTRGVS